VLGTLIDLDVAEFPGEGLVFGHLRTRVQRDRPHTTFASSIFSKSYECSADAAMLRDWRDGNVL
jgi:hypothetical protein